MSVRSAPPTPPSSEPREKSQWRFNALSAPTEWVESYRPGGFHPVNLGDKFDDGRYRILRKLGKGALSTVWLARDIQDQRYVALKIARADARAVGDELKIYQQLAANSGAIMHSLTSDVTNSVVKLIGHFEHSGPNGIHQCLVLEPMCADANTMFDIIIDKAPGKPRYPLWLAKSLLKQLLVGLHFLHSHKIAHGDLHCGNLLFASKNLAGAEEKAIIQSEEEGSVSEPIRRKDGKEDKWAPRYLCLSKPLSDFVDLSRSVQVKLSDLGSAFPFSNPPKSTQTPMALRAPELLVGEEFDHRIDIWNFGCLLYEFITGTSLFGLISWPGISQQSNDDDHLLQMVDALGQLPSFLFDKWTRRGRYLAPDGKLNQMDTGDEETPASEERCVGLPLEEVFAENKPSELGEDEARAVLALIRKTLAYDKDERPTTEQLLREPWFQGIEIG